MARTKTTYDTFNAIAEPKRRALIEQLAEEEKTVGELVDLMQWNQPMVSKHLGVLKEAGLVSQRRNGRQRLYRVNANKLQPIQIWVRQFEKHWNSQFDQLDEYLSELQGSAAQNKGDTNE